MYLAKPARPVQSLDALAMPGLLGPELARLLAEVGFLAVDQRDWLRAHQIFSVLAACRPECEFPYVGLALIELLQSRFDVAAQVVNRGLTRVPESAALVQLLNMVSRNGVPS